MKKESKGERRKKRFGWDINGWHGWNRTKTESNAGEKESKHTNRMGEGRIL